MNHTGSVDTGDVEFVDEIQTLRLAHFPCGAGLAIPVFFFPLLATLTTPAVFLFLGCLVDDRGVRVAAWATLSAIRAALHAATRLRRVSRSWWAATWCTPPVSLFFV